jgi:thioredoxin reductase/SAM-dependent methyltransferase
MDETTGAGRAYDVVVVGGGAAGLSAALTLGRSRRSVLVVDAGEPRNAPAGRVHGYLGREGTSPAELLAAGRAEVAGYGVDVVSGTATSAQPLAGSAGRPGVFEVLLADGTGVVARRLLVTTGLVDELPDVQGLAERWGRDVLHCPYCHGWEVRDQALGVLGSGPLAVHGALLFRQWSDDVTLFLHTAPEPTEAQREELAARGVTVVEGEVAAVEVSDDRLSGVRLRSGRVVARQALVVAPRATARAGVLASLGVTATDVEVDGHVVGSVVPADPTGATSVPGVWVAGNVADLRAQVVTAAASGVAVGAAVNADLIAEDTRSAVAAHRRRNPAAAAGGAPDAAEWDERYASADRVWSGEPNAALVAEVAGLAPGRALDVGCGEGADAVWLAQQGWAVTALDVSAVALERAAQHADQAGVQVEPVRAGLVEARLPVASFDLVSAQYPALLRTPGQDAERALLAAVAPGGTLLVVHHADVDTERARAHGFDPELYVGPSDVAALLEDDGWRVEVDERRPRQVSGGAGAHHTHDLVLRARRLPR